jgi:CheY-like chemotaxis protein
MTATLTTKQPLRVLVIDDDDISREVLTSTLREGGHEVFELATAIGATMELYRHHIDAVVLDVMMPDINGDRLAKVLRGNSRGRRIVIILVSSQPLEEIQALAATSTADGAVAKAQVRSQLSALVTRLHDAKKARATRPGA